MLQLILVCAVQINWIGSAIFTFFVLAFGFYLWVRITKTMDLGKYLAYGIFVLVVEVRHAIVTLLTLASDLSLVSHGAVSADVALRAARQEPCSYVAYPSVILTWSSSLTLTGHGCNRDDAVRYHIVAGSVAARDLQKPAPHGGADPSKVGPFMAQAVGQKEAESKRPRWRWLCQGRASMLAPRSCCLTRTVCVVLTAGASMTLM